MGQLQLALGRLALMHKEWAEAERQYGHVGERFPNTAGAAEAMYWSAVSHFQNTHDHAILAHVSQQLAQKFPGSIWTAKASPWLPGTAQSKTG